MPRSRGRTLVRWFGILLVLGLGAIAVALVVLGDSQKQLRIGVLLGIWAAVVAYFLPPRDPCTTTSEYEPRGTRDANTGNTKRSWSGPFGVRWSRRSTSTSPSCAA